MARSLGRDPVVGDAELEFLSLVLQRAEEEAGSQPVQLGQVLAAFSVCVSENSPDVPDVDKVYRSLLRIATHPHESWWAKLDCELEVRSCGVSRPGSAANCALTHATGLRRSPRIPSQTLHHRVPQLCTSRQGLCRGSRLLHINAWLALLQPGQPRGAPISQLRLHHSPQLLEAARKP